MLGGEPILRRGRGTIFRRWMGWVFPVFLHVFGNVGVAKAGADAGADASAEPSNAPAMIRLGSQLPLLVCFESASRWECVEAGPERRVLHSPDFMAGSAWNELILSWNIEPAGGSGLATEVSVFGPGGWSRWYGMGEWSLDGRAPVARSSIRGQKDAVATVKTDTLVLRRPASRGRLRLTLRGELAANPERLRLISLALSDTAAGAGKPGRAPGKEAWGKSLEVPERTQLGFPGGEGWCSPTSVSMVLGWWSKQLKRPELEQGVPEVAMGVEDPGWPGTGNWPFNTAYAGSFRGMLACVARLRDLRAVEDLIAAGIPVVISVFPPALRGREKVTPNSGHLIVCTGFTADGDVRVNDPFARPGTAQRVARTYPRANVERAWEHAHRLAYLIVPAKDAGVLPAEWR